MVNIEKSHTIQKLLESYRIAFQYLKSYQIEFKQGDFKLIVCLYFYNLSNFINMKNIPRLDGIRSVAIIMVIVYHYFACIFDKIYFNVLWKYPIHALSQMFIGVDLFFILSGYLVGSILFKNKNSNNLIPKFYIKRVLRIIPAYCRLPLFQYHFEIEF